MDLLSGRSCYRLPAHRLSGWSLLLLRCQAQFYSQPAGQPLTFPHSAREKHQCRSCALLNIAYDVNDVAALELRGA